MYRQGDVLLRKIDKIPKKTRLLDTDVILEGEATGHAHRLLNGQIFRPMSWRNGSNAMLYVKADKGAKLVHDEHHVIELEPGFYEVFRQREYEPGTRSSRWIMD